MSIINILRANKVWAHIGAVCEKNNLCQIAYRMIWADRIQRLMIVMVFIGYLLIALPHIITISIGFCLMLGGLGGVIDRASFRHRQVVLARHQMKSRLLGESRLGLWCRDQLMGQTTPGEFEITAIVQARLQLHEDCIRTLTIERVYGVECREIKNSQEKKAAPIFRYFGALIPPLTSQVHGVQIVLDLFRKILSDKNDLRSGPIDIQLKCRLSSDANLHLPNQRLVIEECLALPTQERHI